MRFPLFFLLMLWMNVEATTYHVATGGNDTYPGTQAQPWATLGKVVSMMGIIQPGDNVLLQRGGIYPGSLNITRSGNVGALITFGAYGTGPKPIINCLAFATNWTLVNGKVWQCNIGSGSALQTVIFDGQIREMGRFPAPNNTNGGYLTIDAHSGKTSITDAQLTGNWAGVEGTEVVQKTEYWVIDRHPLTGQSGTTLTYSVNFDSFEPRNGFGYFIQNHPAALSRNGDWYYKGSTGVLQMYFDEEPFRHTVLASIVDDGISINQRSFIRIQDIEVRGADRYGAMIKQSHDITIQNCDFNFSGRDGISTDEDKFSGTSSDNLIIQGNTVSYSLNTGIRLPAVSFSSVSGNIVRNSGLLPGMGRNAPQNHNGIYLGESPGSFTVAGNYVYNSGYNGIVFTGSNILIENNVVDGHNMTVTDGAAFYTWNNQANLGLYQTNRIVRNNIGVNGYGQHWGTIAASAFGDCGFYSDDRSKYIEVRNNIFANSTRAGILAHNSSHILADGNLCYNNKDFQILLLDDPIEDSTAGSDDWNHDHVITNNTLVCGSNVQVGLELTRTSGHPSFEFFGTIEGNKYIGMSDAGLPVAGVPYLIRTYTVGGFYDVYNVAQWKTAYPAYDQTATQTTFNAQVLLEFNGSATTKVVSLPGVYVDAAGNTHTGAITLQPYSGAILSRKGDIERPDIKTKVFKRVKIKT